MASAANNSRLEGKIAVITGGASGIGASAARLFNHHGAKVVIADIQDDLGRAIAAELGQNVSYVHCDVSVEDDVRSLVDAAVLEHGRLDIMYSNAGIIDSSAMGSIVDVEKCHLERVLGVNLVGAFLAAKHAARAMVPRKNGCILFTSSACTSTAGISTHAYAASKHGLLGLMKNLTVELGQHGIRVNCVSPFAVATGIRGGVEAEHAAARVEAFLGAVGNLKGAVLKAEGVAQAALYLASDDASYVSGLDLVVDGGFSVVNPSVMNMMSMMNRVA